MYLVCEVSHNDTAMHVGYAAVAIDAAMVKMLRACQRLVKPLAASEDFCSATFYTRGIVPVVADEAIEKAIEGKDYAVVEDIDGLERPTDFDGDPLVADACYLDLTGSTAQFSFMLKHTDDTYTLGSISSKEIDAILKGFPK